MLYYISDCLRIAAVLTKHESFTSFHKTGIGRALDHQKRALTEVGISYTLDEKEDYDILHINTYGINSHNMVNKARREEGKKLSIMRILQRKISEIPLRESDKKKEINTFVIKCEEKDEKESGII
ncbi:hypothetical protein EfmJHP10_09350 [Enterococcus faecium]|nr:hypothetical protein EfmJHP10_09350 [Enterococcus faecium]